MVYSINLLQTERKINNTKKSDNTTHFLIPELLLKSYVPRASALGGKI